MNTNAVTLTLIDGPTLLIELGGLRLLTDPTFDEPRAFTSGAATERKFNSPPVSAESLLPIDAVLLSHDQHFDNLDPAGRAFLPKAGKVISTIDAGCAFTSSCSALDPTQPADSYLRKTFTVENGLTNNIVNTIFETQNGFLWLVTGEGFARFDGRHFEKLKFPPEVGKAGAAAIAQASDGALWVGVLDGVMRIPADALDQFDVLPAKVYHVGPKELRVSSMRFTRSGVL